MAKPALFQVIELPYCQALMFGHWDAAPGRFFVGYRTRHGFDALLGNGVVDEFRTISGPILLAPASILGGIYDAGLRLADARDVEAPIDQGWPPLTVGIDVAAPDRPDNWIEQLLRAIQQEKSYGKAPWKISVRSASAGNYSLQRAHCSTDGQKAATIIATDAPMLPQQLERLADIDSAPITIAVSVGNRLPRISSDEYQEVNMISEEQLATLLAGARRTT